MPTEQYHKAILKAKAIPNVVYMRSAESEEPDYGLVSSEDTKLLVDRLLDLNEDLHEVISNQVEMIDVLKEIKEALQGE